MRRVVYWARLPLARQEIIDAINGVDDVVLEVVESLGEVLEAMPGAFGLVLYDAPPAEAREIVEALEHAGTVRWLHFVSAGREGFDAVGLPSGLTVTDSAGAAAPAVAEQAVALLLALGRQLPAAVRHTAARVWDRGLAGGCSSLEGSSMVIVGYGHIGREVARRVLPFGAEITAVSRTARRDALVGDVVPLRDLHYAFALADSVVLTLALAPGTRHVLDEAAFAVIRRGALLVNVGRGGLVDQRALAAALRSGQLGGAALDVTDPEPPADDDPLWQCPRLLLTPHYAAASPGTARRLAEGTSRELRSILSISEPQSSGGTGFADDTVPSQ